MILALSFHAEIPNIYIKCGTETRTRYINIGSIANSLGPEVCKALLGVHAFTGCDSLSAFSGRGKIADFKLLQDEYLSNGMADIGME